MPSAFLLCDGHVSDLAIIVLFQYIYYQKPRDQVEDVLHSKCEYAEQKTDVGPVVMCPSPPFPSGKDRKFTWYVLHHTSQNLHFGVWKTFCIDDYEQEVILIPSSDQFHSRNGIKTPNQEANSCMGTDTGCAINIENDAEQQLKGWQKHLAKYQRGITTPLLLNQAWNDKSSELVIPDVPPPHSPPSIARNKNLRRVIMQYGLEYGPPNGPLLRIHHGPLRRHGKQVRRAVIAATVGLVGLVCVGTAISGARSGGESSMSTMGLAVGRKLLTICKDPRSPWIKDIGTAIGYTPCFRISSIVILYFIF